MGLFPNILPSSKSNAPASSAGTASAAPAPAPASAAPATPEPTPELSSSFYCPITMELMKDPVIDRDGISYERVAITEWLEKSSESPVTRKPLHVGDLVPNRSLRELISQTVVDAAKNGKTLPPVSPAAAPAVVDVGPVAEFETPSITITREIANSTASAESPEVEVTYCVSVNVPETTSDRRLPATVCCVVDTSGSMCSEASVQGVESSGLSMLDIVKHAVRTIITSLDHNDRFALVQFSDAGSVLLELTPMTPIGKSLALEKVEVLKPGGMTNLWDGLLKGMEVLEHAGEAVGNGGVFLLTDGVPSNDPPRGYIPSMIRYKEKLGRDYPGTINTFGFGYSLDSQLLTDIAVEGGGMYSFIPDSGFVGTAFVNSLGNHLSRMGKKAVMSLELHNGTRITSVDGKPECVESTWGLAVKLPSLLAGASQEVVFRTVEPRDEALASASSAQREPNVSVSFCYEHLQGVVTNRAVVNSVTRRIAEIPETNVFIYHGSVDAYSNEPVAVAEYYRSRLSSVRMRTVDFLRNAVAVMRANPARPLPQSEFTTAIDALAGEISELMLAVESFIARFSGAERATLRAVADGLQGLRADLTGQITEALSKLNWYTKWGRHYLPSLQRAHLLRQSNNFKDPGIQGFGGRLFRQERDKADDVFMSLPPPKPSRAVVSSSAYGGSGAAAPPAPRAVDMSMYNNASAGCVHEDSLVLMRDGAVKAAREIRRGDIVRRYVSKEGKSSLGRVECVVKTSCPNGQASLVPLATGLRITAWHPVRRGRDGSNDMPKAWIFPAQCPEAKLQTFSCDFVYTFVVVPVDPDSTAATNDCDRREENASLDTTVYADSVVIDGTECIALGHGIQGDSIASHAFLGTSRVIDALRACRGWDQGEVCLRPEDFQREEGSDLIHAIKQSYTI